MNSHGCSAAEPVVSAHRIHNRSAVAQIDNISAGVRATALRWMPLTFLPVVPLRSTTGYSWRTALRFGIARGTDPVRFGEAMNESLEIALKNGGMPFCLNVIYPATELPLYQPHAACLKIAELLSKEHASDRLLTQNEWHSHDGFPTPEKPTSWELLGQTFASPDTFWASRSGDFSVFVAVFSTTGEFLFRYYIDDDEPPSQATGIFDLTAPSVVLHECREEPGCEYFRRIAG